MNVGDIKNCYGCGVCAMACGKHIVEIVLNGDGFYEPCITDRERCTDCGLCAEVCSYSHDGLSLKDVCIKSYAAWSNDEAIRRKCSSGGLAFEIGRTLIDEGYKVCGVRYDADKHRAEHYIASTVEELIPSIGSKYIPSYTVDGFKAIDRKGKYLLTGTPCQIDSFRRYLRRFGNEDNFVLLDFFCHGVPSMLMWDKYVAWAEERVGKLTGASWRDKSTGWHDSWAMAMDGQKGERLIARWTQGDMFYRLFLSDSCLGKACYVKCKFKYDRSSADIRIGDLWGKAYSGNQEGVSAAVAFTRKGAEVLRKCDCVLTEHPFEAAAEGQMKESPSSVIAHRKVMCLLRERHTGIEVVAEKLSKYMFWEKQIQRLLHPWQTIRNLRIMVYTYIMNG